MSGPAREQPHRDIPGPLVFLLPQCPLCGASVDDYICDACEATWNSDGTFRGWNRPHADQCDSVTRNPWTHLDYRCLLHIGHTGHHKHFDQASWHDRPTDATTAKRTP